jgi:hypothetical protein
VTDTQPTKEKGTTRMNVLTKSELRRSLGAGFSAPLTPEQIDDIYEFCLESVNVAHLPDLLRILTGDEYEAVDSGMVK